MTANSVSNAYNNARNYNLQLAVGVRLLDKSLDSEVAQMQKLLEVLPTDHLGTRFDRYM